MTEKKYIEFTPGLVTDQRNGRDIDVKALLTPLSEMANRPEELVINEEVVECNPLALSRLVRSLRRAEQIESKGMIVDCMGFTALMAGGIYYGMPRLGTPRISGKIAQGLPVPVEILTASTALEPYLLGQATSTGGIVPVHAHVKFLAERDLWVERFGDNNVVALAELSSVAAFYHSPQTSRLYGMDVTCDDQLVMSYAELDETIPTTVRTLVTGSE